VPQVNLEIVEPGPELNGVTMRVHERGAGITRACGTGACAAAYASKLTSPKFSSTWTVGASVCPLIPITQAERP
jgi:diaminopimelate epimerase